MKDSSSEPNLLLRYIITACFPKMNQRFKNKPLSEPYFESLRSVNMDQIVFHESEPKLSPSDSEFFLDYLPLVLSAGVTTKVPNILRQVDLIKELAPHLVKQREYIPLYTKDTYKEFHSLFIELLHIMKVSLKALNEETDLNTFRGGVEVVQFVGTMLQRLAKGNVLKIHLKTIESSLEEHRRDEAIMKLNKGDEGEPDEIYEPDEDLEAIQPQARDNSDSDSATPQIPLHASYSEWLKLMLVYFDSFDVLKGYFAGTRFPFKTIDIEILVSPRTSDTLLPWEDVFNSEFLSEQLQVGDQQHLNNDALLAYFKEAATSNLSQSYSFLIQAKKAIGQIPGPLTKKEEANDRHIKRVKTLLTKLSVESTVPGWKEWAKEQLDILKLDESEKFEKVADAIQSVLNGNQYRFFKFLNEINSGKKIFTFGGTMHCEISLISLLVHSVVGKTDGYEDIRTRLKVG